MTMTEAALIEKAHAILLSCLKEHRSMEEAVIDLIGLFEKAGYRFASDGALITPASDEA